MHVSILPTSPNAITPGPTTTRARQVIWALWLRFPTIAFHCISTHPRPSDRARLQPSAPPTLRSRERCADGGFWGILVSRNPQDRLKTHTPTEIDHIVS